MIHTISCLLLWSTQYTAAVKLLSGVKCWCRYEDTGDQVNSVVIFKIKAGKGSVTDFGDPSQFLKNNSYLFGENTWKGE